MPHLRQFCTFYLENYLFGISLLEIQEVIQHLDITEVPLAPSVVQGLMNLRGQIVLAVDLRRQLELPERPAGMQPMNLVVRAGEEPVSLLVDEIADVVEVGDETFEPVPETLHRRFRSLILGVHKLDKLLLHVLDPQRVCEIETSTSFLTPNRLREPG